MKVFDSDRAGIGKDKLLICCFIVMKRMRNIDNKIDSKRGIVYDREIAGKLSIEERSFLLKDHRQITEAYLKYI